IGKGAGRGKKERSGGGGLFKKKKSRGRPGTAAGFRGRRGKARGARRGQIGVVVERTSDSVTGKRRNACTGRSDVSVDRRGGCYGFLDTTQLRLRDTTDASDLLMGLQFGGRSRRVVSGLDEGQLILSLAEGASRLGFGFFFFFKQKTAYEIGQ